LKARGKHPEKALSAVRVRSLDKAGRYADGNGLYLIVEPSGAKRWVLRTVIHGRRTDMGLGGLMLVTLAEAREKALAHRKIARDGGDPIAERRRARAAGITFEAAARLVHAEQAPSWKNQKHAEQWISTLEAYVFPIFGSKRVAEVDGADVLRALTPIWLTKQETARRVRQRIGLVLDWARAHNRRTGDNPIDTIGKVLPKQSERAQHHMALPYVDVPQFLEDMRAAAAEESTKLAFELLILTAARTSEVVLATPAEMDERTSTWIIPAARMKAGREHRVPLSDRCIDIVRRARELAGDSAFLFPGRTPARPLSNMAFLQLLKRMGVEITAHGFRSAFRDWAAERTHYTRDVCEAALAHVVGDKTEAAYRRGDLIELRRALMAEWARFCESPKRGDVIPLRAKKEHAK
jgi:integrase